MADDKTPEEKDETKTPEEGTEEKPPEEKVEEEAAPAAEGEAPAAEGEAPAAEGEAPAAEGETPAAEGEAPAAEGEADAGWGGAMDEQKAAEVEAKPADFGELQAQSGDVLANLDMILDIPVTVSVELGRSRMIVKDLLSLGQGAVIELEKLAGETLEILVNGRLIAKGEAVVVNEKFGVKLTDILSPGERVSSLT
jgi:flagellar motor switch protein FliN/FliY